MFQTNSNRNNEIVTIHLSIGQCKRIERLLDEELQEAETGTSVFSENALKALLDVFTPITRETDTERQQRFENWVGKLQIVTGEHG